MSDLAPLGFVALWLVFVGVSIWPVLQRRMRRPNPPDLPNPGDSRGHRV